jgi:hypothetical protein
MVASQGGFRAAGVPKLVNLQQAVLSNCKRSGQQTWSVKFMQNERVLMVCTIKKCGSLFFRELTARKI